KHANTHLRHIDGRQARNAAIGRLCKSPPLRFSHARLSAHGSMHFSRSTTFLPQTFTQLSPFAPHARTRRHMSEEDPAAALQDRKYFNAPPNPCATKGNSYAHFPGTPRPRTPHQNIAGLRSERAPAPHGARGGVAGGLTPAGSRSTRRGPDRSDQRPDPDWHRASWRRAQALRS